MKTELQTVHSSPLADHLTNLTSHTALQLAFDELENKSKNINDSLHYARRIQRLITTSDDVLKNYFEDSFIIDRPKDIVSGDFCWFAEVEEGFLIAVGDCTGHGVPGAMISMTGSTLLNEIVCRSGIVRPSVILRHLDAGFRNVFSQGTAIDELMDGMDIAICLFRKNGATAEFAGANRPLFLMKDGSVEVINGDKRSIGYAPYVVDVPFPDHVIALKAGDMIILSTDGITDQFGGIFEKKFMRRNLIKLIESSGNFSAAKTGELLENEFQNWKGKNDQTDDILVIGMKI